jgi:sRNA-binding carbon storage regulator CsrA
MKSIYLLPLALASVFGLGLNAKTVNAAIQPNSSVSVNVSQVAAPSLRIKVNRPNRNVTPEEIFQDQQEQWQNQQDLFQQKQAIWQRNLEMKMQQQYLRQLYDMQQQQQFKIRR